MSYVLYNKTLGWAPLHLVKAEGDSSTGRNHSRKLFYPDLIPFKILSLFDRLEDYMGTVH